MIDDGIGYYVVSRVTFDGRVAPVEVRGVDLSPPDGWTDIPGPAEDGVIAALRELGHPNEHIEQVARALVEGLGALKGCAGHEPALRAHRQQENPSVFTSGDVTLSAQLVATPGNVCVELRRVCAEGIVTCAEGCAHGMRSRVRFFRHVSMAAAPVIKLWISEEKVVTVKVVGSPWGFDATGIDGERTAVHQQPGRHILRHRASSQCEVYCERTLHGDDDDEYTVGFLEPDGAVEGTHWLIPQPHKTGGTSWMATKTPSADNDRIGVLRAIEQQMPSKLRWDVYDLWFPLLVLVIGFGLISVGVLASFWAAIERTG
jgi:hypothetical protein